MQEKIEQAGVTATITGGLVPPEARSAKRRRLGKMAAEIAGWPSRALSHIDHLNRELNRKTAAGTAIPDDAAIFSTGEIVRVKGEPFRVKSLDPKRLVLEGVREPQAERPTPSVSTWTSEVGGSPTTATLLVFLGANEEPVTSEVDRYDEGQRVTIEGTEYVVTGKVLVLAPVLDESAQLTEPSSPA